MPAWKPLRIALSVWFGLLLAAPAPAADKYVLDPVHSYVGFSVRHMMVSWVRGEFKEFSGEIWLDEKDLAKCSVSVIIKPASLDTNITQRDQHLKSADFLSAEQYPEITFKSKRIERAAEGYLAVGELTIRGVTKEVSIPFTLSGPIRDPRGGLRLGVEAGTTVNRHDFGVSWNRVMEGVGLVVGDEVKIALNVEAVKEEPKPQPQTSTPPN